MNRYRKPIGKVIKTAGLNIWPHEQTMADTLALNGHVVEFIPPKNRKGEYTTDSLIDGVKWEMKSPRASSLKTVERNLKIAKWQSNKIVFASRRMKGVPDIAIERELRQCITKIADIDHIKFINRHGHILDIKKSA
jgi:hypothetical protein